MIRTTPKLAIDMDGTLAASKETVFEYMGEDVSPEDHTSWEWPVEQFGADRFLGTFDKVWSRRWYEVSPTVEGLAGQMHGLREWGEIHVVTAQPAHDGVTDGKTAWLEYHGIPYDEFHAVPRDETKASLDYDVFVDDKPSLPECVNDEHGNHAQAYLYDQPYNQDAPGEYVRVESIQGVVNDLAFGSPDAKPSEELGVPTQLIDD